MSVAAIETRRSILLTGWCVLAAIVLALVIAVGVSVGELAIPLQNVFYAISNRTGLTAEPLNRIYESVIWDFRLSRALVAACCGAGLAICGVVLQSLLKNALAEPYVLGVSAGASTGAVSIVVLGLGAGAISLSAGAFAGAFAAFAFVALLTNGARGGNERTILAGVAASQLFNAITAYTISTSASALAGAILMVLADIASRLLIAPQSLPVGVVTALVGVPFFAVIIYRSRNK